MTKNLEDRIIFSPRKSDLEYRVFSILKVLLVVSGKWRQYGNWRQKIWAVPWHRPASLINVEQSRAMMLNQNMVLQAKTTNTYNLWSFCVKKLWFRVFQKIKISKIHASDQSGIQVCRRPSGIQDCRRIPILKDLEKLVFYDITCNGGKLDELKTNVWK